MNIKIKAKNKDQKRLIHKMILKSVKEGWGKIEASNTCYSEDKKGRDYRGCEIEIVDIWAKVEWARQIPSADVSSWVLGASQRITNDENGKAVKIEEFDVNTMQWKEKKEGK
tara:strand:- start:173 stop:508 length:336 start_codon:yes stop_codon:yes gene_type:complete